MMKMAIILFIALALRLYGINWDQGYHLHPDERMLIMVTEKIDLFKNLNPNFFNYGSLPMYILRLISPNGGYDSLLISGRILSVVFDLVSVILVYFIAEQLFKNKKISLFSSFLYSVAFFSIQNAHFFVVDVFLTAFTSILIYLLLLYNDSPRKKILFFIGITFAAMLATKFTAIIFYPIVVGIIFWKTFKKIKNLFLNLFYFHITFAIIHFLFMPYAYIEYLKFISDIKLQLQMNSNPYIFPYTLQYVGTLPYFYYLKNIFLWGLGPLISILSLIGLKSLRGIKRGSNMFVFFIFYLFYFLIVGRSAVKFMRYMLPIYPFFSILAGYGLVSLQEIAKRFLHKKRANLVVAIVMIALSVLWTFLFMNIYLQPNSRITATDWILKNIPKGSTIAIEHWDDRLPIYNGGNFKYEELTLYDQPDSEYKWKLLNEKLNNSDYLIIASNRLYVPLQKLVDCSKYLKCYPKTPQYYKRLFNGELGFKKIAEFKNQPLFINDQTADESFTVYDHPKIMIFKKLH